MTSDAGVTVYVTMLNERDSIGPLLDSLLSQTRKPDEIVLVDGGSTDGTTDIVKQYVKKGHPIRLIASPGANVAAGRNIGIGEATFEIVASADAGCRLDSKWLENLTRRFSDDVDVVAGVYLPDARNTFEECVGDILYPSIEGIPEDWSSPSHRSVAFKKKVWEAIGPIPERLYRSEDTWFNIEAKRAGFRFRTARDAVVYWRPRRNLREVFRNAYLWTKSDIENDVKADLVKHVARVKLLRIIWRVLGILALLVCCIYISWLAAILLAPFVFKEMISFYVKDRSMKKAVYKNLINLAIALAYVRGYLAASWSLRASKKRGGGNGTQQ